MPKIKKVFETGKVRTVYTYVTPTVRVAEIDNSTGVITYHLESKLFDKWTKKEFIEEYYDKK